MGADFSLLICGKPTGAPGGGASELGEILAHLKGAMEYVLEQLSWLDGQDPQRVSLLGPFLGRSLLELSATALVGRLDPLRLLVVRQVQAQVHYDHAIQWNASIRWQGDVFARKAAGDGLWSQALEYEKVTKALLGDYYDHLVWRPAVQRVVARPESTTASPWLAQLAAIDLNSFVPRKRDEVSRLYSSLSKGIHHEFVLPPGKLYDRATVVDLVQRTIHSMADMGLVSHFVAHASSSLVPDEAVATFNRVEALEVMK